VISSYSVYMFPLFPETNVIIEGLLSQCDYILCKI
jgi:hypothetical protein